MILEIMILVVFIQEQELIKVSWEKISVITVVIFPPPGASTPLPVLTLVKQVLHSLLSSLG
jgi:hypothetical protein